MLLQADDAHSGVPTVTVPSIGDHTSDSANQNKNNPLVCTLLQHLIRNT